MVAFDAERVARVSDAVGARVDDMVELLIGCCAIGAENPPGRLLVESQAWILDALAARGVEATVHDTSTTGGDHRVIVGTVGSGAPHVYLHGHYDVVPAAEASQFDAAVVDGAVVGRGAADMKGGLVSMLTAALVHRELGGRGRVELVYVPDEETGGANGSERLIELGLIDPIGCAGAIVGEPSHPDIWYSARGAFTVEVTISGRPAHVGLHYTGSSAFERAHEVIGSLLTARDDIATRRTAHRIEPEAARSSIMLIGGVSGGGTNFNIVPDQFRFTIDRRPNPDEDGDAARTELLDLLADLDRDGDLHVEVLQDVRAASTDVEHDLVRTVEAATAVVRGRPAPLSMCPGCLETRVYVEAGIPAVAYGPGPMAQMHAPGERVPVANLVEGALTLGALLGTG